MTVDVGGGGGFTVYVYEPVPPEAVMVIWPLFWP